MRRASDFGIKNSQFELKSSENIFLYRHTIHFRWWVNKLVTSRFIAIINITKSLYFHFIASCCFGDGSLKISFINFIIWLIDCIQEETMRRSCGFLFMYTVKCELIVWHGFAFASSSIQLKLCMIYEINEGI